VVFVCNMQYFAIVFYEIGFNLLVVYHKRWKVACAIHQENWMGALKALSSLKHWGNFMFYFYSWSRPKWNCVVHVFYKSQLSKVYCFHGVMKL